MTSHLTFWQRKLERCRRPRLPYDHRRADGKKGTLLFFFRDEILARLVRPCRQQPGLAHAHCCWQHFNLRWRAGAVSGKFFRPPIPPIGSSHNSRARSAFWSPTCRFCARLEPAIGFRAFLADFAREFYGSYAHRELSCELYDAIFAPPKPFCGTVFNFVPLQKRFLASELLSLPAFDGVVAGPDGARPPSIAKSIWAWRNTPTAYWASCFTTPICSRPRVTRSC